jgi:hypothetical protein
MIGQQGGNNLAAPSVEVKSLGQELKWDTARLLHKQKPLYDFARQQLEWHGNDNAVDSDTMDLESIDDTFDVLSSP